MPTNYYERQISGHDADENPVTITVTGSPTDDPRVMVGLSAISDGRDGYPLSEMLTLEPGQLDLLIESLTGARDYLRSHAGQHQRSAPIVVASAGGVVEYKFDCACDWGSAWHVTEELARQEHGQHAADALAGV